MPQKSVTSPLVSVVIPSLNRADLLVPTIESVLRQDYRRIECIVVDGGSTDGTLEILRRYVGKIKWISEIDQGPPDAINKGWEMCSGEILAWLNADDLWAPGTVSKVVAHFEEHPEVDVVYGDCGIINCEGKHITTTYVQDWDLEYAVKHCDHMIYQAASFMRRRILEHVGWLYPKLCHDHELWLRISLAGGKFQRIPALLAYARDHGGNLGYRSDLVIPLKLQLTEKFFENPGLPQGLLRLRDRAMSNAYLNGIACLLFDSSQWPKDTFRSLGLVWKAIGTDPSNVFGVLRFLFKLVVKITFAIIRPFLPDGFREEVRAMKHRVVERLFHGNFTRKTEARRTKGL